MPVLAGQERTEVLRQLQCVLIEASGSVLVLDGQHSLAQLIVRLAKVREGVEACGEPALADQGHVQRTAVKAKVRDNDLSLMLTDEEEGQNEGLFLSQLRTV